MKSVIKFTIKKTFNTLIYCTKLEKVEFGNNKKNQ